MLLGVDVGGTFTDAVLIAGGNVHTAKSPTTPRDQSRGVIAAVETVLELAGVAAGDVEHFAHGMTVGTNALLERRGASTALIATDGFTDLLEIARQDRPSLYHLCDARPSPLSPPDLRIGARERIGADGVSEELTSEEVERVVAEVEHLGPESVAICLLFSYADPSHERALAEALRTADPELHVSVSSEVLPRFREYERCSTTVLDAYLAPLLARYLERLRQACSERGLTEPVVMQSSGGVAAIEEASRGGAWSVLSGPAGGAVGAGVVATASGDGNALGLDMGGTSCDVCVIDQGRVRRTDEREFAGRPIQLPAVDVHTVGAGGGSIAWRDEGGALRVGPRSAGADPGPACYGRGGTEPTVTDANLLLGYLSADTGLAGSVDLDLDAAREAIGKLAGEVGLDPEDAAAGIVAVANAEMTRALRVVTVERGVDPREYALLPFGGAGPLHAAGVAAELEMSRIVCPRAGGVLSALGLIASERRRDTARTVMLSGEDLTAERIASEVEELASPLGDGELEVVYGLRYRGQAFELPVPGSPEPDPGELADGFAAEHERRYGYRPDDGEVVLVDIRVAAREPIADLELPKAPGSGAERSTRRARFDGEWLDLEVIGGEPEPGFAASGPCAFELPETTLILPPGWNATVDDQGTICAEREKEPNPPILLPESGFQPTEPDAKRRISSELPNPITLQVLVGGLRAICDEMGAVLIRSAHSPNIKERRDCSTALFDAAGELVMQAEHIPVHLGSMPDAVAAVAGREQSEGDLWILNDPFAGGTHLPDITLISPLFADGGQIGWAASRAHHADVGGPTPGGMPADSRRLEDEGIVIEPQLIDDAGLAELAGRMRNPAQRLADLRAQRAANLLGARRLAELIERVGLDLTLRGMEAVLDYAERRTRAAIAELPDGTYVARDQLEAAGGEPIPLRVAVTIEGDGMRVDFDGSAGQVDGNLNCPLAVTRAATIFAARVLTDPDAPPSAGAQRPVEISAPEGSVLNARPGAGVAAGNVETSSRVADLVLRALGDAAGGPAQGQGTMNNLTLAAEGEDGFTYYETLGGGQGACADADGPSAVHVAMSNTLNTPVEALETELPLRVRRLEVRRGSGGEGARRGGDGIVREIEALAPMRFTLITERRSQGPEGRDGGENGEPGANRLNGEPLPAKTDGELQPGDVLRIETPGGGGHGQRA